MSTNDRNKPKIHIIIAMLGRPVRASIQELVDATGWKATSVRGAISGEIRKRRMMDISSEIVTEFASIALPGPMV